ncbi:MAG: protein kinase [Acidobacteriota bacterium]
MGTRLFLVSALSITLAVIAAVAYSSYQARRIAREAVSGDLAQSSEVQAELREIRIERQDFDARLVSNDPFVAALFAEALESGDSLSIRDQLEERQADIGYDFAVLVDLDGRVAAWTGRPDAAGRDVSGWSLVGAALEGGFADGFWVEEQVLYDTVAVPVGRGFELIGYLITGVEASQGLGEIAGLSNTELVYLTPNGTSLARHGATLEGEQVLDLVTALEDRPEVLDRVLTAGERVGELDLLLGSEPWLVQVIALRDAAGEPVAAAVTLASVDQEMAPFQAIGRALLWSGAGALLLALALAFAFGRNALRPIQKLAAAATAARGGDYDQEIQVERGDEVGDLARSFDQLLSDLREKRDMESYLSELSRSLPDGGIGAGSLAAGASALRSLDGVFLGCDIRSLARVPPEASKAVRELEAASRAAETAVARRGGRLDAVAGHRLWARFEGADQGPRALAAAAEIASAFDEDSAPALALAKGRATVGTASGGSSVRPVLMGPAVQQLESLLREASPGEIVFPRNVAEELAPHLASSGFELSERRGVLSPQPLFILTGRLASRMTASVPVGQVAEKDSTSRATLSDIRPGQLIGSRFEIMEVIGSGGMGVVYKARDRELDDLVALKMLRVDRMGDPLQVDRLKAEIKLARKITHPNVLRTFDLDEIDGMPFLSMEYIRGITLRFLLDRTDRLPYSAGLRLARQLCLGLDAAHRGGVLHRDIKPENLILEPSGNAKLMDFGIARRIERAVAGDTAEGAVMGTPLYLAPEVLEGREADARSDLYAVGVVLYEIFTGEVPFSGIAVEVMAATLRQDPPAPRDHWAEIPAALERIILDCLQKEPEDRPDSTAALLHRLDQLRA